MKILCEIKLVINVSVFLKLCIIFDIKKNDCYVLRNLRVWNNFFDFLNGNSYIDFYKLCFWKILICKILLKVLLNN